MPDDLLVRVSAQIAQAILSIAFLGYGVHCLIAPSAKREFIRYGFARFCKLTGALEILGSVGLMIGFYARPLLLAASLGLATLMFLGIMVRLRIRDSFREYFPALGFFLLSLFVFCHALVFYSML